MFNSYDFARAHEESTNNGMIVVLKFSIHVIYSINNIIIKRHPEIRVSHMRAVATVDVFTLKSPFTSQHNVRSQASSPHAPPSNHSHSRPHQRKDQKRPQHRRSLP